MLLAALISCASAYSVLLFNGFNPQGQCTGQVILNATFPSMSCQEVPLPSWPMWVQIRDEYPSANSFTMVAMGNKGVCEPVASPMTWPYGSNIPIGGGTSRSLCAIVTLGAGSSTSPSSTTPWSTTPPASGYGLPALRVVTTHSFSTSYSCNGSYNKSGLFVSGYARQRNSPEVLYNGACGSSLYFESSLAGDAMSLVADLGTFPLLSLSAHLAFNTANQVGKYESFKSSVAAVEGHTYAVLVDTTEIRALIAFNVVSLNTQTLKAEIDYAALEYQIMSVTDESPGFSWVKTVGQQ